MKILHATILLSVATSFSLHPMKPIKTKRLQLGKTINNPVVKEKSKHFFNLKNMDNIASAGNILSASLTGHPLFLLQMIPQMLHRTITYWDAQKKSPSALSQDLNFFVQCNPIIFEHLDMLEKTTQKINFLKTEPVSSSLDEYYRDKIAQLENARMETKLDIIQEISPLINVYDPETIADVLQEKNHNLVLHEKIEFLLKATATLSIINILSGPAILNFFTSTDPRVLLSATLLSVSATLFFSTMLALKNSLSLVEIINTDPKRPNLKDAIEILKIQQAHLVAQQNHQSNE